MEDTPRLAAGRFIFLAVEKEPPYAIAGYRMEPESEVVKIGRITYRRNLETYLRCKELDYWPAYSDLIEDIGLPTWALRKEAFYG